MSFLSGLGGGAAAIGNAGMAMAKGAGGGGGLFSGALGKQLHSVLGQFGQMGGQFGQMGGQQQQPPQQAQFNPMAPRGVDLAQLYQQLIARRAMPPMKPTDYFRGRGY